MKVPLALSALFAVVSAHAQFVVLDWETVHPDFGYGFFENAMIGGGLATFNSSSDFGGFGSTISQDLSMYAGGWFELTVRANDLGSVPLYLSVETYGTSVIRYWNIVPAEVGTSLRTLRFDVSSPNSTFESGFGVLPGNGNAGPTNLSGPQVISIFGTGNGAGPVRYSVGALTVVPEPASMAGLGLGLVALRRQKSFRG